MDVEYTGAVEERDGAAWYKFTTGEVYPSHEDTGFLDLYLDSGKEYAFAIKAAAPVDFKIRVSERICDAGTDPYGNCRFYDA